MTATTIQNCWRKVEILPREAAVLQVGGADDSVMHQLAQLLTSFATTVGEITVQDVIDWPEEQWTAAPDEDDDADAELVAALRERAEDDEEEADESTERMPMTLKEAREASEALKLFVEENQAEHPQLRECKNAVENLNRLIEQMSFSARSKQTTMEDHFPVARSAAPDT